MHYLTESRIIKSVMPDDPDLRQREGEYVRDLAKQGKIIFAYRLVGGRGSFMLWDAASNDEMHQILAGFPMNKYLEFKVIPVVPHPSFVKKQ